MTIASCSPPPNAPAPGTNQPPASPVPTQTPIPTGPTTSSSGAAGTATPPIILTLPDCPTPIWAPTPTQTGTSTPTPTPTAPSPSPACNSDCYDSYLTYDEVVKQLGRIPSIEEVLYMTAGTEYAAYSDNQAVANFGQEGLARTYYSVCYIKDGITGCQGDELYQFLSGYEPWSDRIGTENNKKTPQERGEHLIHALNVGREWLWVDVNEINDFRFADAKGWTDGRIPDKPWQWFGPFRPSDTCLKNVKPSIVIKYENGYEFWMLTSDETIKFNSFGCK